MIGGIQIKSYDSEYLPLLDVSRQIRKEAARTYYFKNRFLVGISEWDPSVFTAFATRARTYGCPLHLDTVRVQILLQGSLKKWNNLLSFLKAVYDQRIPRKKPRRHEGGYRIDKAAQAGRGALSIIAALHQVSWDTVVSVLEVYKEEVARGDGEGWEWE